MSNFKAIIGIIFCAISGFLIGYFYGLASLALTVLAMIGMAFIAAGEK